MHAGAENDRIDCFHDGLRQGGRLKRLAAEPGTVCAAGKDAGADVAAEEDKTLGKDGKTCHCVRAAGGDGCVGNDAVVERDVYGKVTGGVRDAFHLHSHMEKLHIACLGAGRAVQRLLRADG